MFSTTSHSPLRSSTLERPSSADERAPLCRLSTAASAHTPPPSLQRDQPSALKQRRESRSNRSTRGRRSFRRQIRRLSDTLSGESESSALLRADEQTGEEKTSDTDEMAGRISIETKGPYMSQVPSASSVFRSEKSASPSSVEAEMRRSVAESPALSGVSEESSIRSSTDDDSTMDDPSPRGGRESSTPHSGHLHSQMAAIKGPAHERASEEVTHRSHLTISDSGVSSLPIPTPIPAEGPGMQSGSQSSVSSALTVSDSEAYDGSDDQQTPRPGRFHGHSSASKKGRLPKKGHSGSQVNDGPAISRDGCSTTLVASASGSEATSPDSPDTGDTTPAIERTSADPKPQIVPTVSSRSISPTPETSEAGSSRSQIHSDSIIATKKRRRLMNRTFSEKLRNAPVIRPPPKDEVVNIIDDETRGGSGDESSQSDSMSMSSNGNDRGTDFTVDATHTRDDTVRFRDDDECNEELTEDFTLRSKQSALSPAQSLRIIPFGDEIIAEEDTLPHQTRALPFNVYVVVEGYNESGAGSGSGSDSDLDCLPEQCLDGLETYVEFEHNNPQCIRWNEWRRLLRVYFVGTIWFDNVILVAIVVNCVFIALDNPTRKKSQISRMVNEAELPFSILFTIEMFLKWIAFGWFKPPPDSAIYYEYDQDPVANQSGSKLSKIEEEGSENGDDSSPLKQSSHKHEPSPPARDSKDRLRLSVDVKKGENNPNNDKRRSPLSPSSVASPPSRHAASPRGHHRRRSQNRSIDSIVYGKRRSDAGRRVSEGKTPSKKDGSPGDSALCSEAGRNGGNINGRNNNDDDEDDDDDEPADINYAGYFRDGWNWIDFVVVLSSWVSFLPGSGNYTSIRVLRVLRPLRTVTKIDELRLLISTILLSLRGLADVLVLLTFLLITFAIIGLQSFSGALHQQCFALPKAKLTELNWRHNETLWEEDSHYCPKVHDSKMSKDCPSEYPYCLDIAPNPDEGMTSFDNIILSFVQIFVTVTLEGWVAIMYRLQAAVAPYVWVYFVLLTFVVSFFAINLCLAVIEDVYGDQLDLAKQKHDAMGSEDSDEVDYFGDDEDDSSSEEEGESSVSERVIEVLGFRKDEIGRVDRGSKHRLSIQTGELTDVEEGGELPESAGITLSDKPIDVINQRNKALQRNDSDTVSTTIIVNGTAEETNGSASDSESMSLRPQPTPTESLPIVAATSADSSVGPPSASPGSSMTLSKPTDHQSSPGVGFARSVKSILRRASSPRGSITDHSPNSLVDRAASLKSKISSSAKHRASSKTPRKSTIGTGLEMAQLTQKRSGSATPIDQIAHGNQLPTETTQIPLKDSTSQHSTTSALTGYLVGGNNDLDKGKRLSKTRESLMSKQALIHYQQSLTREDPSLMTHRKHGSAIRIFGEHEIQPDDDAGREERENRIATAKQLANTAFRMAQPKLNAYLKDKPDYVIWLNKVVTSNAFRYLVMVLILLNTVVLALEWPSMNRSVRSSFETMNTIFTVFFILELLLKMVGLGHKEYFNDRWNLFDFVIVILSIADLLFEDGVGGVSALRGFRLLRVFRLLGRFENMRLLLSLVVQSLDEVLWLTVILFIFMFMFATLGMSTFGGGMAKIENARGRWRFDTFYWSMVAVFQVITGDAWNEVMYDAIQGSSKATAVYFIAVVCFGTFIVLNIFMAILLKGLSSDEMEEQFMLEDCTAYAKELLSQRHISHLKKSEIIDRILLRLDRLNNLGSYRKNQREWKHHRDKLKMEGVSLGFFPPDHWLRVKLHTLVSDRRFDYMIDVLILINCVFLAMETPGSKRNGWYTYVDLVFTAVFVIEMVIKIIALSCFPSPFGVRRLRIWKEITDNESMVQWSYRCCKALREMSTYDQSDQTHPDMDDNIELARHTSANTLFGFALEAKCSNDGFTVVHFFAAPEVRMIFSGGGLPVGDGGEMAQSSGVTARSTLRASEFDGGGQPKTSSVMDGQISSGIEEGLLDFDVMNTADMFTHKERMRGSRTSGSLNRIVSDLNVRSDGDSAGGSRATRQTERMGSQEQLIQHHQQSALQKNENNDDVMDEDHHQREAQNGLDDLIEDDNDSAEFLTAYVLTSEKRGEWAIWNNLCYPKDDGLEEVCKSFDMSDNHHNAYMASNWNRLDFLVVIVAIIGVGRPEVTFLRALRAFRPFRIMVRVNQIKVVLSALVRAIPSMFNTMVFCFVFWFIIAILGVNRWSGRFRMCVPISEDSPYDEDSASLLDKDECAKKDGLKWQNAIFNFDHVFEAVHTLFVVATLSGWNDVMYMAVDSTTPDRAPKTFNHPENALYFVAVIVICSFFSLNLIVSVVVDNFNKIKAEKDGSAFQTKQQREWVRNQSLLSRISLSPNPPIPKEEWRKRCYKLVQREYFEPFILSCIVFNALTMACEHYNQSQQWTITLEVFDTLFVIIFTMEAILKLSAYGYRTYFFYDNWNRFDFLIVIVGIISSIFNTDIGFNVFRLFRIGRVLRLINKAKTLKMLFYTLLESAPSLVNIGMLLFVIFFIYAVIGMHLFGDAPVNEELYKEANFSTFSESLALLYRVGTEDGWTDVYEGYLRHYEDNMNEQWLVYVYFMTFFVFGTLVLINLFIAVVLDSFQDNAEAMKREEDLSPVKVWRDIWLWWDPEVNQMMDATVFIKLLLVTPQPAGFAEENPFAMIYNILKTESKRTKHRTKRFRRNTLSMNMRSTATSLNLFGTNRESKGIEGSKHADHKSDHDLPDLEQISQNGALRRHHKSFGGLSYDLTNEAQSMSGYSRNQRISLDDSSIGGGTFRSPRLMNPQSIADMSVQITSPDGSVFKTKTMTSEQCMKKLLAHISNEETRRLHMENLLKIRELPTHREIIQFLMNLKLSVHRKTESEMNMLPDQCEWYVKYRDALICLCGEVAGPKLSVDANNEESDEIDRIDRWYCKTFGLMDIHKELMQKQRSEQHAKKFPMSTATAQLVNQNSFRDSPIGSALSGAAIGFDAVGKQQPRPMLHNSQSNPVFTSDRSLNAGMEARLNLSQLHSERGIGMK